MFVIFFDVQMMEEEEVEVPVAKAAKMDTDETPSDSAPSATEADINMQDAKFDTPGAENGVPDSKDNPIQMETDAKVIRRHLSYKLSCGFKCRLSNWVCCRRRRLSIKIHLIFGSVDWIL